jgi:hypothetical protein
MIGYSVPSGVANVRRNGCRLLLNIPDFSDEEWVIRFRPKETASSISILTLHIPATTLQTSYRGSSGNGNIGKDISDPFGSAIILRSFST